MPGPGEGSQPLQECSSCCTQHTGRLQGLGGWAGPTLQQGQQGISLCWIFQGPKAAAEAQGAAVQEWPDPATGKSPGGGSRETNWSHFGDILRRCNFKILKCLPGSAHPFLVQDKDKLEFVVVGISAAEGQGQGVPSPTLCHPHLSGCCSRFSA